MNLARVTGSVWMTEKHPAYEGKKLLVVQPETPEGAPKAPPSWPSTLWMPASATGSSSWKRATGPASWSGISRPPSAR